MHVTSRTVLTVALGTSIVVAASSAAVADDGMGTVNCQQTPAECAVHAGAAGSAGRSLPGGIGGLPGAAPSGGSVTRCENPSHQQIPCQDPDLGSVGPDGCYYKPTTRPAGRKQPSGRGGWYTKTCTRHGQAGNESLSHDVWRPGAYGGQPAASPQQVAQMAVRRLDLPKPIMRTNPPAGVRDLVGVPVWWWVAAWPTRTATASVPGVSVTAIAHPVQVAWVAGDGGRVVCTGPGTRWRSGTNPTAASPDCGHVFRRSSHQQPGGRFRVTATMRWQVVWSGAHQSGTITGLSTSDSTSVRVVEAQAVNTRP